MTVRARRRGHPSFSSDAAETALKQPRCVFLPVRDVRLGKAARSGRLHRCDNLRNMGFDETLPPLTQYDNRNLAACKILLIAEIFVRRNQHFESCGLGFIQQFAVFQLFPSTGTGFRDHVAINQKAGESSRRAIVEQNQY